MKLYEGTLQKFAGAPFHHFAIHGVTFSFDERKPTLLVTLGHYKISGTIELNFSDVIYHSIMSESYVYLHDEDDWDDEGFLAVASQSQLISHLAQYTLIESMGSYLGQLKHYRVIGQNFFVEVVATSVPKITLRL